MLYFKHVSRRGEKMQMWLSSLKRNIGEALVNCRELNILWSSEAQWLDGRET